MNDQGFENSGHNFAQDHEPVDEVIEENSDTNQQRNNTDYELGGVDVIGRYIEF